MLFPMFHAERLACVAVLAVVLVSAQASSDDNEYVKEKRAGVLRLFPFPRVGRSDPDVGSNWDNSYIGGGGGGSSSSNNNNNNYAAYGGSFEEYDVDNVAQLMEPKRPSMRHPFARTGRSGGAANSEVGNNRYALQAGIKRAGAPGSANGMWFGPRLGRVQKRNSESTVGQAAELVAMQDMYPDFYKPRLGRSSGGLPPQQRQHRRLNRRRNDRHP